MWKLCRLSLLVVTFFIVGCSSGSESSNATAPASTTEAPGDEAVATNGDNPDQAEQPTDRIVQVRNLVTEPEADEAIQLLSANGFDGFIKQPSSVLFPTATEGWDVVHLNLTAGEANKLAILVTADPEVPYAGIVLVAEASTAAEPVNGSASSATGTPGIASQTAVVTVGTKSWSFALSGDEGHCSVGGLRGGDNGVIGTGRAVDASGNPDPAGALVTMNIYPEKFIPRGTQSNAVGVDAPGDDADWGTAGPGIIADAEVPALADAVVHSWTYSDGWATGTATFVLESSVDEAQYFDGELVTEAGSFEINCRDLGA